MSARVVDLRRVRVALAALDRLVAAHPELVAAHPELPRVAAMVADLAAHEGNLDVADLATLATLATLAAGAQNENKRKRFVDSRWRAC